MIGLIIESLSGSVEDLNLLQAIYPLCEQKESQGKTTIERYIGNGEYKTAFNIDNYNGVGYFRKVADTKIEKKENPNKSCSDLQGVKYQLRFVASIQRKELPTDCPFSDDELGWMIAKELTGRSAAIKQELRANTLYIQATNISTDRKKILTEELPGNSLDDINYSLSLVAIDFDIDIDIEKTCIASICDSYYQTT